jgi:hypothetical protein
MRRYQSIHGPAQRCDARRRRRIDSSRSATFEIAVVTRGVHTRVVDATRRNRKMLSCFFLFNRYRVQVGVFTSQLGCKRARIRHFASASHDSSGGRRFALPCRRRRRHVLRCIYKLPACEGVIASRDAVYASVSIHTLPGAALRRSPSTTSRWCR